MVSSPNVQNVPGLVRKFIFAASTFKRTASTPGSIRIVRERIGLNLRTVRMSEASWASPVTIEHSLNTTLTLLCGCTRLALLWNNNETSGGNVENRGESGRLQSLGIENGSIVSTRSKRYSAMLRTLLYRTPKLIIACMSMLAIMCWARCPPRCKIRQRRYRVISAVSYTMCRRYTLHTTQNYWASETQYYTRNSIYMEPSSHCWYTWTMQPWIGSSHNHTSLYVRWISWQS